MNFKNWNDLTNSEKELEMSKIETLRKYGKTWDEIGELYSTNGNTVKKYFQRRVSESGSNLTQSGSKPTRIVKPNPEEILEMTENVKTQNIEANSASISYLNPSKKKYVLLNDNGYDPENGIDRRQPIAYFNCIEDLLDMPFLNDIRQIELLRRKLPKYGLITENRLLEDKMKTLGNSGWCYFYGSDNYSLTDKAGTQTLSRWDTSTRYWIKKNHKDNFDDTDMSMKALQMKYSEAMSQIEELRNMVGEK